MQRSFAIRGKHLHLPPGWNIISYNPIIAVDPNGKTYNIKYIPDPPMTPIETKKVYVHPPVQIRRTEYVPSIPPVQLMSPPNGIIQYNVYQYNTPRF